MYILNNVPIRIDQDLVIGVGESAITIPAGSLQNAATREKYGILEVEDPVRMDDRYYFNHADGSAEPKPLDLVTPVVWELIKARRDSVKSGGVQVLGKWFHTDDPSRIQHMALSMMGQALPAGLEWKTMDGSFATMTPALAGQVFQAVAALDMQAFTIAEQKRSALMALETVEEIAAFDFSAGWPQSYAEWAAEQA